MSEAPEGWLTDAQAERLRVRAAAAGAGTIVEIGSFRGRSTIVLAGAAAPGASVVAIDPHAGAAAVRSGRRASPSTSTVSAATACSASTTVAKPTMLLRPVPESTAISAAAATPSAIRKRISRSASMYCTHR